MNANEDASGRNEGTFPHVAVLIPCYNEAATIREVVTDFRRELPSASIIVIDNNSADGTADVASAAGAETFRVRRQGKGHAVRAALQRVDADIYVLVDGDQTYEPRTVHALIEAILDGGADMAVARRVTRDAQAAYRPMHVFGNQLVARLIRTLFSTELTDILSGYRAFTREVVRCTPLVSRGFEIETELTVQTLGQDFVIVERDSPYYARPEGSVSKLRTVHDGVRVLWTIAWLFMAYKPLTFFGAIGLALGLAGVSLGILPLWEFAFGPTRSIRSLALAMGSGLLLLCALGFVLLGVVLTTLNNRFMAMASLFARGRLSETHWMRRRGRARASGESGKGAAPPSPAGHRSA